MDSTSSSSALAASVSLGKLSKLLLPHERMLLESGKLQNVTHKGASSIWLEAPSTELSSEESSDSNHRTNVYRPMGDSEILHLIQYNRLPNTQPYQAIIEGEAGRKYAEMYLNGKKWVDTSPSTVVEFTCPKVLIEELFKLQHKVEDGVLSMGLGHKAGGGLGRFNESLEEGETTWRIVKVKRTQKKK